MAVIQLTLVLLLITAAIRAMKGGAFDLLEKPFQGETLLKRVREALALDAEQRRRQARCTEARTRLAQLSAREREVMDRVAAVIAALQPHDSPERFCALGAEVRFGAARFADDHVVEIGGARVSARSWVIATGSRPALPPVPGLDAVPFWTNENVFAMNDWGESVIRWRNIPTAARLAIGLFGLVTLGTGLMHLPGVSSGRPLSWSEAFRPAARPARLRRAGLPGGRCDGRRHRLPRLQLAPRGAGDQQ